MAIEQKFHAVFNNDWDSLRLVSNGPAPLSTLPLDNTKESLSSLIVRFETTGTIEIAANHDNGGGILSAVSLVGHSLSGNSRVRVVTFDELDPVYGVTTSTSNTGWIDVGVAAEEWGGDGIEAVPPFGSFIWGSDESANEGFLPIFTVWLDDTPYKSVVIMIEDPGSPRIDIERIVLGQAWKPKINHDWNATVTLADESEHFRPAKGNMRTIEGSQYREFSLPFGRLEDDERIELLRQIRKARKSGDILFCSDPTETDARTINENTALVRLESDLSLSKRALNRSSSTITFSEVRSL